MAIAIALRGFAPQNNPSSAAAKEEEIVVTTRSDREGGRKDDTRLDNRYREGEIIDIIRDVIAAEFDDGGITDAISTNIGCTAAAVTVWSALDALAPVGR